MATNNLLLSSQIGAAFLEELVAQTPEAEEVKERMKGFTHCNPNPAQSGAPTMTTAFNNVMANPDVIDRFHELRDTLPPSEYEERMWRKLDTTSVANTGIYYPSSRHLVGDTVTQTGGMTNSRELTFQSWAQSQPTSGIGGGDMLVRIEGYMDPANSLKVLQQAGVYMVNGMIAYTVARAFQPGVDSDSNDLQTSPTFLSNNDAVVMDYRLFLTVNSSSSPASSVQNGFPGVPEPEIINRLDAYYSQELLSGKFTKNEITKNTVKKRGFSTMIRLNQGDTVSLQLQRGPSMATYGSNGDGATVFDGLFQTKSQAAGQHDPDNWIEFIRMA